MTKVLAIFIATMLSLGILSIPNLQLQLQAQAQDEDEDENGDQDSAVQVTVEREGAETEDINVTPNITVVVDFEQTQVTNESVIIGEPASANSSSGNASAGNETIIITPPVFGNETGTEGNQTQNATAPLPPVECVTEPCPPSEGPIGGGGNETTEPSPPPTTPGEETPNGTTPAGNETTTPPVEGNETIPVEGNVTVPEEGGNETIPVEGNVTIPEAPVEGNETTTPPVNETAPPAGNETGPPSGNTTTPEVPPVIVIPPGNDTGPITLPNGTIPVDNGTTTEPETPAPDTQPNAINLALIESIQRGHTQHITAFVTDDKGNEFMDEQVNIMVINQNGKILQNVQVTSGQGFAFKVGPNTSPQTIDVIATLDSNKNIGTQADYDVFPKARPAPPELPVDLPPYIELPPLLNQSGVS